MRMSSPRELIGNDSGAADTLQEWHVGAGEKEASVLLEDGKIEGKDGL